MRSQTLLDSSPAQQPDSVIVTPFLRVCFAVIMRMFMDHQQFLVYIKDSPKNPAKLSTSSQTCTLLSPLYLCAFPLKHSEASGQVSRGSAGEYQADERAVSRGSAGEYQADERAGVARLSWRVSGR